MGRPKKTAGERRAERALRRQELIAAKAKAKAELAEARARTVAANKQAALDRAAKRVEDAVTAAARDTKAREIARARINAKLRETSVPVTFAPDWLETPPPPPQKVDRDGHMRPDPDFNLKQAERIVEPKEIEELLPPDGALPPWFTEKRQPTKAEWWAWQRARQRGHRAVMPSNGVPVEPSRSFPGIGVSATGPQVHVCAPLPGSDWSNRR